MENSRRSDGGLVKSYGDFIEYLLRKSPEIHALQMDFEGKNIMLYFLGDTLILLSLLFFMQT